MTELVPYQPAQEAVRTVREQWGVRYNDGDIEWFDAERPAREHLDLSRQWSANEDDEQLREVYAGARLVRRSVTTIVSTYRFVPDT